jgi:hypothetical protein
LRHARRAAQPDRWGQARRLIEGDDMNSNMYLDRVLLVSRSIEPFFNRRDGFEHTSRCDCDACAVQLDRTASARPAA